MFVIENLLNLVIYVRNVNSKNIEPPFPSPVVLNKKRSALFFNALSFCFDFSSFQTTHKNKNKLRTNWGWSSQKIKNNEPRQSLLVLIKKKSAHWNNFLEKTTTSEENQYIVLFELQMINISVKSYSIMHLSCTSCVFPYKRNKITYIRSSTPVLKRNVLYNAIFNCVHNNSKKFISSFAWLTHGFSDGWTQILPLNFKQRSAV